MKVRSMRYAIPTLFAFVALTQAARAGNWHSAGSLRCADCHLQHSSDLSGGTPYEYLLIKNSINELCLSCHDGSDPTAPDVQAPVTMYSGTASQQSAAGYFSNIAQANPNGHDLGLVEPTPLENSGQPRSLTCASCHAVHGNANYRNLLEDPAGVGASLRVAVGTDVFVNRLPDDPPTVGGSAAAYEQANSAYKSGMTQWCSSCHDRLATNVQSLSPAHFDGHPSDISLNQFGPDAHTDSPHWVTGLGEGFPDAGISGIPRVPFQSPQASSFSLATTPMESNEVSCVSCHKAHGSANQKGMLWPYLDGGTTQVSGCQQCHNK